MTSLCTQPSGRAARDRLRVRDGGFTAGLGCGRGCCFCGRSVPAASPRPPRRPLTLSVRAERKSRPAARCLQRLRRESRAYQVHAGSALRGPCGAGGAGRSPVLPRPAAARQLRGRPWEGLGRGSGVWVPRAPRVEARPSPDLAHGRRGGALPFGPERRGPRQPGLRGPLTPGPLSRRAAPAPGWQGSHPGSPPRPRSPIRQPHLPQLCGRRC